MLSINIDENIDIIASWFITPKDCKCPSNKLTRDGLSKLIERYDFVIFDCEFDLKYLNSLVDCPIDEAIIVSDCNKKSIVLASKIADFSKKYATNAQLGVVLNKADNTELYHASQLLSDLELDLIGYIEKFDNINYDEIANKLKTFYSRMNLPQIEQNRKEK